MVRRNKTCISALKLVAFLVAASGSAQAQVAPPPSGQKPATPGAQQPVTPTGRTPAQDAAAGMGRDVSNQQITDAIKRSGLSEQQIRLRLEQAGFDAKLADPFFSPIPGGVEVAPNPAFLQALAATGILSADALSDEEQGETDRRNADKLTLEPPKASPTGLQIFGKSVFNVRTTQFEPLMSGAVDAGYRLGPGDQIQIVFTGEVEVAYSLDIRRDGSVILPQIGQVFLGGLTLEGARGLARSRAKAVYSGIESEKTKVDISLSRVRSNLVFVLGEVETPGALVVSGMATVFNALARAGGPSPKGSFRSVQLRRAGKVIAVIDLYDYLLRGDASADVRLEQGDIIFVPLAGRRVTFRGAVRRAALFELTASEGFPDLRVFSGGLVASAALQRLQIDRVLPPADRTPGRERAIIDIALGESGMAKLDTLKLLDEDIVSAFQIGDVRRNSVRLSGEVFQPGVYEWNTGLRLGALIARAEGFMPWALKDRVKILRGIPETGRQELISLNFADSSAQKFVLEEFDEVTVLDARLSYPGGNLTVSGAVNLPGTRRFAEGMTLQDLLDIAGGLKEEAIRVEISRRRTDVAYTDTASTVLGFDVSLPSGVIPEATRTLMQRGDRIAVLGAPGFREPQLVSLAGLFARPGQYAITQDGERVSSVIARAGGLLPTAYSRSFRLTRGGRTIAIDLAKALRHVQGHDIAVRGGDQLRVQSDPATVIVTGGVERSVAVPFRAGWGLDDYLDVAGGLSPGAKRSRILVESPSGMVRKTKRMLWVDVADPEIVSGSTITVLQSAPGAAGKWRDALLTTAQMSTTLIALIIGYKSVSK